MELTVQYKNLAEYILKNAGTVDSQQAHKAATTIVDTLNTHISQSRKQPLLVQTRIDELMDSFDFASVIYALEDEGQLSIPYHLKQDSVSFTVGDLALDYARTLYPHLGK